eukprot:CAMPEP_0194212994 /NCGR_PEP_ID=MMETSP0156-20130528/13252_1 /TAXON_ID=33649 /ORGANISM="Thalassionema nitzschioides, Strain L26-B" /LENGTH=780 /DNA_ID=CAMNT_0038940921 /DNA_START=136 /DNA_END=2478 /DNA_ORIENTATION=-
MNDETNNNKDDNEHNDESRLKAKKPRKTIEELEKLHTDLQSKKKARSVKPATTPGAVSIAPSTKIDSDLRAKENALSSKTRSSQPATVPGAVANASVTPGAQACLTSLESRISRKIRGDRESMGQNEVVLGAVASAGPMPSKVEDHIKNPTATANVISGVQGDIISKLGNTCDFQTVNPSENPAGDPAIEKSTWNQPANPSNHNADSDQVEKWYEDDQPDRSQERNPFLPPNQSSGQENIEGFSVAAMNGNDGNEYGDSAFAPPVYQQAEFAGNDGGGIEAFVAEPVVAATGVALLKTPEEEEAETKKKVRKYMLYAFIALALVMAAIITPIAIVFTGPVSPEPTRAPSVSPTDAPSDFPSAPPSTTGLLSTLEYLRSIEMFPTCPENAIDSMFSECAETQAQFSAAEWIADEDTLSPSLNSTQFLQRYILAVFYFSTRGDQWTDCHRRDRNCLTGFSWLTDKPECQWDGVRCDDTPGIITRILIGESVPLGNNLEGTIPSELAKLSALSSLTLVAGIFEGGKLHGQIPSELGLLTLESIYIQAHQLTGSIPEELLVNQIEMQMFAVSNNMLSGALPTSVVDLPKLIELQLHGNMLTGTIPEVYGSMTTLEILELQLNDLEGSIPDSLYNLTLLSELSLEDNNLNGTISSRIENLDYLRIFSAGENSLSGNIPQSLFTLPELKVLRIAQNNMSGPLSEDLVFLNNSLQIFEGNDNNFSGNFSDIAFDSMGRLRQLFLHNTDLTGAVPMSLCDKRGSKGLRKLTVPSTVDCSIKRTCCDEL